VLPAVTIGKGCVQELRDVPQSVTVVTEKLIDDRNLDTLKDALKQTAGISFLAAEGGEEDIRLRGFSLQATGDIFIDGMRDPAFYERDSFNWDRLEVLRGSASMLFGRGSTGGAVNQVSKQPRLTNCPRGVALTLGSGGYLRACHGDLNLRPATTPLCASTRCSTSRRLRRGHRQERRGARRSVGHRHRDEFLRSACIHCDNDNGIHYGLPWLTPEPAATICGGPQGNYYGMASDVSRRARRRARSATCTGSPTAAKWRTTLRVAAYTRDQRASAIRFAPPQQPGGLAVTQDTFATPRCCSRSGGNRHSAKIQDMDAVYAAERLQTAVPGLGPAPRGAGGHRRGPETGSTGFGPPTRPAARCQAAHDRGHARRRRCGRRVASRAAANRTSRRKATAPMCRTWCRSRRCGSCWAACAGTASTAELPQLLRGAAANQRLRRDRRTRHRAATRCGASASGVLYQPTPLQSFHLSYGTSFNTVGRRLPVRRRHREHAPEKSRNLELGAKLDSRQRQPATRVALFHATKYNERNRDAESVNATNYVLSGKRHAAGLNSTSPGASPGSGRSTARMPGSPAPAWTSPAAPQAPRPKGRGPASRRATAAPSGPPTSSLRRGASAAGSMRAAATGRWASQPPRRSSRRGSSPPT
jgi:catecholate siderophore receptor